MVGNRTAMTVTTPLSGTLVTTYTHDAANRLQFSSSAGQVITYTWDHNGNLTSDGSQSYTYDQANRLVGTSAIGSLQIWHAGYNGDGARVWTSYQHGRSPTIVTDDILDPSASLRAGLAAPLPAVLTQYGIRNTHYVYAGGTRPLAQHGPHPNPPPQAGEGEEWVYYLPDGLGSVRQDAQADAAGAVLADAWGNKKAIRINPCHLD
ncbi:MAG: hypothetical protein JW850_04275 [Thermoflexales bacterium]|nr:hypothetical protein [Thermoflexales bacterium]